MQPRAHADETPRRPAMAIVYAFAVLIAWAILIAVVVVDTAGHYGCATQTGVIEDSPIQPEQDAPAATQPTQQVAAIAIDSDTDTDQAAPAASQPVQQADNLAAIAVTHDTDQTMSNSGPASQATQQDGTVNYVGGDRTTYNDPKLMYACLAAVIGYMVWRDKQQKKFAIQQAIDHGYEHGRQRRLAKENGSRLPGVRPVDPIPPPPARVERTK